MRASPAAVISAVFVAEMAATFESAMIFGAMPKLIGEYGDPLTAGWLVTMHMLVSAATYAVAGRLGDIRGRKQVMLVLIAIAACGSLLSAVTHSLAVVLAGRALQGFGSAVMPLSIGILRENLPEERMPVSVPERSPRRTARLTSHQRRASTRRWAGSQPLRSPPCCAR